MPSTAKDVADPLQRYSAKRNFRVTPEPEGRRLASAAELSFVVQKHWASRLHYDFRLELDGVLLSWAVPKGPSYDPKEKRMAVHVEDHPVSYGSFEGTIPPKQYGAGTVIVWDRGTWEPVGDPRDGMVKGKLVFKLHGQKLAGLWELVRIAKPGDKQDPWMLFKKRDAWARPLADYDVVAALPDSVVEKPLGLLEAREQRAAAPTFAVGEPDLSKAVKAALPATCPPQLATLATTAPGSGDWVIETKFDGYRLMARLDKGKVALITRGGHDWTAKLPALAAAVEGLGVRSGWLDGEIVVLNERGLPDFNRLQNAIDSRSRGNDIVYFVFDAPFLDNRDLRKVPLRSRRTELRRRLTIPEGSSVRYSEDFPSDPSLVVQAACQMGLEGVMLKRGDAAYVSGRTDSWLKVKCQLRQEFVICGFTERSGAKGEVGALLLGYHEDGALRHGGSVGTGWDSKTGRALRERLEPLRTAVAPVDPASVKPGRWSKRAVNSEQWVRPELVAEVAFGEWTPEGHVRHAIFKGLRNDKPARAITRESALARAGGTPPAAKSVVKVTNPERVVDPTSGLRKLDVVRYYESIAEWMLPHLKHRPVSLVRAPEGITGELFFQKHPETRMPGLTVLDAALWPGHTSLLAVDDPDALMSAAQMNTIEFHTWNSTVSKIDTPDRVIFDLDPGEGVKWRQVQEAALIMQGLLTELELESWLKTSGGKGLHVVVPLAPKLDYETVKSWSEAVVIHLAKTVPQRFVAKSGPKNRVGKIFVDYLRNGHAQTTAAAYSARSRPGLGVSMPISWDKLLELKSAAQWTVATARDYLSFQAADPWTGYWTCRQTLQVALKRIKKP